MTGMTVRPCLHREMDVGHGLGFDALRGIDDEQRAFAGGEGAGDFVGEVDVAGGVEQVQFVSCPSLAL